ncbi:homoserine O-acetyltransferase MetX [Nakamurella leprariae]|uniref:homoserine O-acetyltransferase MetX n=1 Tax=Nakamurella leprariae TaxID=2803911 RepID=UPI002E27C78D|nr:homoserine O-acetyltransferase [Nakamurella leprariae]
MGRAPPRPLDPARHFVVAPNVLGGCRGSTGPSSTAPDGRAYGSRFPALTIRDQVRAEQALADALGIEQFAAVIGGSMGGMRVLEWAVGAPDRVRAALAIATTAAASADQIAWCSTQLAAIRADPDWVGGDYHPGPGPDAGLAVARQIAQATYRSATEFGSRFGRAAQPGEDPLRGGRYAVQSYLDHHGAKLVGRFDAGSYVTLTEAMNRHDVGRDRGGVTAALARITAALTVVVVDSDRLYLPDEGRTIATAPATRELVTITSEHGHDGFLVEADQIAAVVRSVVDEVVDQVVDEVVDDVVDRPAGPAADRTVGRTDHPTADPVLTRAGRPAPDAPSGAGDRPS